MSSASSSAAITRTGKAKFDFSDSDLYSVNPCPPVKALPRKCDYKDKSGNLFYDVFKNKKLLKWAHASPLMDMIAGELQPGDSLFFVRQNPQSKAACGEFDLADEGALLLYNTADSECHICQVVSVGDRTNAGYAARSVVWMLVRGLRS
jgi:hypothetical protein